MKLKKANAAFGLLTIALLLIHVVYEVVAYIKFLYQPVVTKALGLAILIALLIHMILGMSIMMFAGDSKDLIKYPGENRRTILQRASAIAIMVLVFGHLNAYDILTSGAGAISIIAAILIQVLFFAAVLLHVATSVSNAFVTLGLLTSMDKKKRIDRIVWAISIVAFIITACVVGHTYILLASIAG